MKPRLIALHILFAVLTIDVCAQSKPGDTAEVVYRSDKLVISRLSPKVYLHTSYFDSQTFGKVPCNGMVVAVDNEAVIFDTPANDSSSAELVVWIQSKLRHQPTAVVPTHFHEDCTGGLKIFHKAGIASHASFATIELAKKRGFNVPQNGFRDSLVLTVGDLQVTVRYFGEGHTTDNVVAYFQNDGVLFGGCLVKELGAGKGNLDDANVNDWAATVGKVKAYFPQVKIVIPGHGRPGDKQLLDYTIKLFRKP